MHTHFHHDQMTVACYLFRDTFNDVVSADSSVTELKLRTV